MSFLISHILFLIAVIGLLCVPGLIVLRGFFPRHTFTTLETATLSMPVSFILTTLTLLLAGHAGLLFTSTNLLLLFGAVTVALLVLSWLSKRFFKGPDVPTPAHDLFSSRQLIIIGIIVTVMIIVKATFLMHTIFPTSTDLGHHMFWANKIAATGTLPIYEKILILPDDPNNADTSSVSFTQPEGIADFIIGEHLIFAALTIVTGQSVVSAFPSLILYLAHFATIFGMFILALRLFAPLPYGKNASIIVLLFIGMLYAVTGAQVKFVSGGVIGNIFGNMLIVTFLFMLYRSLAERSARMLVLTLASGLTLVLTHHLSTFILAYVVGFTLFTFIVTQCAHLRDHVRDIFDTLRSPWVLVSIVFVLITLLWLHTPSYLNSDSISSSVGTPEKSTRVGLSVTELMQATGEARLAFGVAGLLLTLLIFSTSKRLHVWRKMWGPTHILDPYARAIIIGWGAALVLMTLYPGALKVNIISSRIATYLAFPMALCAGLFLAWCAAILLPRDNRRVPYILAVTIISLTLLFSIATGLRDSATSLVGAPKTEGALQTFHAAQYLATVTPPEQWILKDHNYITADTWMKVFIKTDYSNPLSRSFFQRYENNPDREHCTLEMITDPSSDLAQTCFAQLTIGPIVVSSEQDAGQFTSLENMMKVYENDDSTIYWRQTQ